MQIRHEEYAAKMRAANIAGKPIRADKPLLQERVSELAEDVLFIKARLRILRDAEEWQAVLGALEERVRVLSAIEERVRTLEAEFDWLRLARKEVALRQKAGEE